MFCLIFISIPVAVLLWIVYTSRNALLCVGRWILWKRYDVTCTSEVEFLPGKNYLILPNHPALVDPLILVSELHHQGVDVCPLVDESFFSMRPVRHLLSLFHAIRVPDFRKSNFRPVLKIRPEYHSAARRAKALSFSILALLTAGENVLLYPSGHITADGAEKLGNRQLAYNVISQLPHGVEVVAVRIRGLYGSMFSRVGGRHAPFFGTACIKAILKWPFALFRKRRAVSLHLELITQRVLDWSRETRQAFDAQLEKWYDADIHEKGLTAEEPT